MTNLQYNADFVLTHFIYPLEKPICLSDKLGIWLDNFRPEDFEAKQALKTTIQKSLEDAPSSFYSTLKRNFLDQIPADFPDSIYLFILYTLMEWSEKNPDNRYLASLIEPIRKQVNNEECVSILTHMWVILRFDRQKTQSLPEHSSSYESCLNYAYVLSAITGDTQEGDKYTYVGSSFAWRELNRALERPGFDQAIYIYLMDFFSGLIGGFTHFDFTIESPRLITKARQIEAVFSYDGAKEKLLLIGGILKAINSSSCDENICLISLVNVLELILGQTSDFIAVSETDTFEKQFALKGSIIWQLEEPQVNLKGARTIITEIYQQRENLLQGNFAAFEAYMANKIAGGKLEPLHLLVEAAYNLVKMYLNQYTLDPQTIDYLKIS